MYLLLVAMMKRERRKLMVIFGGIPAQDNTRSYVCWSPQLDKPMTCSSYSVSLLASPPTVGVDVRLCDGDVDVGLTFGSELEDEVPSD
jgi:hypothetical protein